MNIETILADYADNYDRYKQVPLPALKELESHGLLGGGFNAAPEGDSFLEFVEKWPFTRVTGHGDYRFDPEQVEGTIPADFTRQQVLDFLGELIEYFGDADEKEVHSTGYFRFWFD